MSFYYEDLNVKLSRFTLLLIKHFIELRLQCTTRNLESSRYLLIAISPNILITKMSSTRKKVWKMRILYSEIS